MKEVDETRWGSKVVNEGRKEADEGRKEGRR